MIGTRQRRRILLSREIVIEQPEPVSAGIREHHAHQHDAVRCETVHLAPTQQLQTLCPIGNRHDLRRYRPALECFLQNGNRGRAADYCDALMVVIRESKDVVAAGGENRRAVDERNEAEIHVLLTRERPRRRAAVDVDASAANSFEPVLQAKRHPSRIELGEAKLRANAARHFATQVD